MAKHPRTRLDSPPPTTQTEGVKGHPHHEDHASRKPSLCNGSPSLTPTSVQPSPPSPCFNPNDAFNAVSRDNEHDDSDDNNVHKNYNNDNINNTNTNTFTNNKLHVCHCGGEVGPEGH